MNKRVIWISKIHLPNEKIDYLSNKTFKRQVDKGITQPKNIWLDKVKLI